MIARGGLFGLVVVVAQWAVGQITLAGCIAHSFLICNSGKASWEFNFLRGFAASRYTASEV